jgi:phage terminase large subunit-like protein
MEGGQVAWPASAAWREVVEAELLAFPHGRHDDIVDCIAYAATEIARGIYSPEPSASPRA